MAVSASPQAVAPVTIAESSSAVDRRILLRARQQPRWNIAEWFILSQTFLPAILYLPGSQPLRVPIRMASYGISIGVLAYYWIFVRPRSRRLVESHPAVPWLVGCLICLGFMLLHPTTNSYTAGVAQIGMYFSILAPIFWASAFVQSPAHLRRLLWLLLVCNGVNAFVGVMQAHDPGTWMPKEFSSVVANSEFGLASLSYVGADGHRVLRPPGLSDSPGGVCGPAVFAMYFGLVFAVADRSWWKKLLAAVFATLGAAAIFLTLVRSSFLIAVGMVVVYILLQIGQGRLVRAGALAAIGLRRNRRRLHPFRWDWRRHDHLTVSKPSCKRIRRISTWTIAAARSSPASSDCSPSTRSAQALGAGE